MAFVDFALNLARAVIVLFIIVDPFGNIPIFIGLTENIPENQKRKVFNTACLVGFILLLVFAFTGQLIFNIFGISIYSFEIAGGILLMIVSIRLLISNREENNENESPEQLGAVPIAMPLLVGPGAITTTILNIQLYNYVVTALSVLIVMSLTWIILRSIGRVYKVLGKTGSLVITRVMALLIAAIAVQYILVGITHFVYNPL
ncbi:MAG TPA: MarC family protein [Candidatus Nanoarchaeia archaeon]|nr:MarC family protein [Candidatus Nanoarchaeia archaeon]